MHMVLKAEISHESPSETLKLLTLALLVRTFCIQIEALFVLHVVDGVHKYCMHQFFIASLMSC